MVKQTTIESAYKKPVDKTGGWGGCASVGLFVVLAIFLATLMSADTKDDVSEIGKASSGQAHLPTATESFAKKIPQHTDGYEPTLHKKGTHEEDIILTTVSRGDGTVKKIGQGSSSYSGGATTASGLRGKNGDTESDLNNLMDVTIESIKKAEQSEVKKEKSMLSSTLSSMGSGIYSAVSRLWGGAGDDVDQSQVQAIANEIKAEVEKKVMEELEDEAEEIEEETIGEISMNVETEEENGADIVKIENDVLEHEKEALSNVKTRIDNKAQYIQTNLASRTAMIEKEMMEKKLSKQLGYEVKLQIVGDQVQAIPPQQQQQQGGYAAAPQQQGGYAAAPPPQQQQQGGWGQQQQQQQQWQQPPQQQQFGNAGGGGNGGGVAYQPPANQYAAPPNQQQQPPAQYGNGNNVYRPPPKAASSNNMYARPAQSNPGTGGRN